LQVTHVGRQGRLIAHGRRNTAEQRRHFRTRLSEAEDVVDEEQDVLAFLVAEVFCHGQARESHTSTGARRLVHLTEYEGHFRAFAGCHAVLVLGDDLGIEEFVVEIVPFAGALTDTGEYGHTTVAFRDVVDELLNEHGFANAGAAEQADLTAFGVRCEQVDDLDPSYQNAGFGRLVHKRRGFGVDRSGLFRAYWAELVNRFAYDVHDAAERLGPDRHRDLSAGVDDFVAANEAFGRVHCNGANGVFAQMLRNFEDERLAIVLGFKRGQNGGQFAFELHVNDSADDLGDGAVGGLVKHGCGCHFCVPWPSITALQRQQ